MSAGENRTAMPWRAATNPAAQNRAAPAPQAMPAAAAGTSDRGAAGLDVKRFLSRCGAARRGTIISSCRVARAHYQWELKDSHMAALDALSIGILLGALLVLAGIMSSLVAMRFG